MPIPTNEVELSLQDVPRYLAHLLHVPPVAAYLGFTVAFLALALILAYALHRLFRYWTKSLKGTSGETALTVIEGLTLPLLILAAAYTSLEIMPLPRKYEHKAAALLSTIVIITVFYFLARFPIVLLRRAVQRDPELRRVVAPGVFISRALFGTLAVVVILENLGISLKAVWTTLGVGSIAVALALQETLSNFFAGVYLLVDRPINPGDYVKLDAGQEGYVVRVGWRSTWISTLSNNRVVVPNATMAKAVITNYSVPIPRMSLSIKISVAYGTDPGRVEQVVLEEVRAAAAGGLDGLLLEPAPSVQLIPGFGDSTLDFTLGVQVRQFVDQYSVQSELRKRILARFELEGIEMPFPTRTINLEPAALAALEPRDPAREEGRR
jgi:small-conductance mechanosensitive channel